MTDPKKPAITDDIDWDEALAEWEEKSFAPEVARDVLSDRPAALAEGSAARPLYRPPTSPGTRLTPAANPAGSGPRPSTGTRPPPGATGARPTPTATPPAGRSSPTGAPARPTAAPPQARTTGAAPLARSGEPPRQARPTTGRAGASTAPPAATRGASTTAPPMTGAHPTPVGMPAVSVNPARARLPTLHDDEEDGGATLIAAIPEELLRGEDDAEPSRSARGGGLGQLFAREQAPDPIADKTRPPSDPPDVVTSAQSMPSPPSDTAAVEPLRRAPRVDESEAVPEGALFDPFAEEPQPTVALDSRIAVAAVANSSPAELRAPATATADVAPDATVAAPATDAAEAPTPSAAPTAVPGRPARRITPLGVPRIDPSADDSPTAPPAPIVVSGAEAAARDEAPAPIPLPALEPPKPESEEPESDPGWDEADTSVRRTSELTDDDDDTSVHSVGDTDRARGDEAAAPPRVVSWPDEKPADEWLDATARASFEERAAWLEDEARAVSESVGRARGLLACSEVLAIAGHRERAQALAAEARDLAPSLGLAHRQARTLMPWPPDPDDYLESLDHEVKTSTTAAARIHSTLLQSEAYRARGDRETAGKRLDQAARIASPRSADVRATALRAAAALANGETSTPAVRIPDSAELAPLAHAVATCLRLRGVDTKLPSGGGTSANDAVLGARRALARGDAAGAAPFVAELAWIPELASGARWLAASLAATSTATRPLSIELLRELIEGGDEFAGAALVARALELGDARLLAEAIADGGPLTAADRLTVATLGGIEASLPPAQIEAATAAEGMKPLVAAAFAVMPTDTPTRDDRGAGNAQSTAEIAVGRKLARSSAEADLADAVARMRDPTTTSRGLLLELAARAGRAAETSDAVRSWGASKFSGDHAVIGPLAAALVAERDRDAKRAEDAFKAARDADPTCEVALRALDGIDVLDQIAQLNGLADELGEGPRSALARIEAIARGGASLPEPTQEHLLELAHRAAPALPFAAFLAERIARRSGDVDDVVKWLRERRSAIDDRVEGAIDAIREALLVADRDPGLAGEKLREAHEVRPGDTALRDLYERMAVVPPDDVAAWREKRANETKGDTRILLSLEAAYEYERLGDDDGALRCATAAATGGALLAQIALERAELRSGNVARLADELMAVAKDAVDPIRRREAYERLAVLDAVSRNDAGSALLWHRSLLEIAPHHLPSLRHVEQHLVSEGRDDEIEPVAAAIAAALGDHEPGERAAHAELAARLRLRAGANDADAALRMLESATAEDSASLWSLRTLHALARARGDDAKTLDALRRLVDRGLRPPETAFLLARAAETALRLGRADEARSFLEGAIVADPGDLTAWTLLADVRRKNGDERGAAEAVESLARCSAVSDAQLAAWYEAGRLWMDVVKDDARATAAFEAAAAIDLAHADLFDRLSRLYAEKRMQPELADLLRRRIDRTVDPDERLAIEVRRGRVLLEVGEVTGARRAFEAALEERPDDAGALSAFADLCIEDKDWEAAEQALVRLARLLPTADEQRGVYARLGDLYARHLVNLSRAEVALKEVLKRAPNDPETVRKLVEVHKRQNDPVRAVELQQELVARATSPDEKRERIVELAAIHETLARDVRRAEKTLEAARRDAPQDVGLLRALAELYVRHRQSPAFNILLDRAAADARRAITSGRIAPEPFHVVTTVFALRDKSAAAAAVDAVLAAVEGKRAELRGLGDRALEPEWDDVVSPELFTPAIRSLLARAGDTLEAVAPADLRDLRATAVPPESPLARRIHRAAQVIGLPPPSLYAAPKVDGGFVAVGSPPSIVADTALVSDDPASVFLALRSLALLRAKATVLGRLKPSELAVLVSAWLKRFNPTWEPEAVSKTDLVPVYARVQAIITRDPDPDLAILALEAGATLEGRQASLGPAAVGWANRLALLALGDPAAALDAVALAQGLSSGAPTEARERITWISRTAEARDLVAFGASDAFAQARARGSSP